MPRDRRKRLGSSIAAVKARVVSWPTPGMLISRRQASDARTIFLMSASIPTTAPSTPVRAATRPRMAADRPAIPYLARNACVMNAAVNARASRTPNTTARPRIWFSRVTRWPTSFLPVEEAYAPNTRKPISFSFVTRWPLARSRRSARPLRYGCAAHARAVSARHQDDLWRGGRGPDAAHPAQRRRHFVRQLYAIVALLQESTRAATEEIVAVARLEQTSATPV
jgi:hypothetical protein